MKVRFLRPAQRELEQGIEYYEEQLPGLGLQFLGEIQSAVERIKNFPDAWYALSRRTRRCQTKRFPYGIIYQVRNDEILIIAVAHLHRKPGYWRGRA